MSMNKNYYDVLGVSKNATEDDIKKAFRKISKENHPDLQSGKSDSEKKAAEAKFKDAAEAYETLSNKEKRERYDMIGDGGSQNSDFGSFFRNGSSVFSSFFSGSNFSHFSTNPFSSSNSKVPDPNAPENGRNVQINLTVTFKESLFGVTKEFDINIEDSCDKCHGTGVKDGNKLEKCKHCNGTGVFMQQHGNMFMQSTCMYCHGAGYMNNNPCDKCHGEKRNPTKKHINVNIPAGINTGNKLRVSGKGQSGVNGGKNGDLFIIVNVQKSDVFERSANDLKTKIYISPIVASIGGTVDVYSPFGTSKMKIPIGTTTGTVLKIKGKGIKTQTQVGDLYVIVEIEPLVNLTDEQVKLLETFNATVSLNNLKKTADLNARLEKLMS